MEKWPSIAGSIQMAPKQKGSGPIYTVTIKEFPAEVTAIHLCAEGIGQTKQKRSLISFSDSQVALKALDSAQVNLKLV